MVTLQGGSLAAPVKHFYAAYHIVFAISLREGRAITILTLRTPQRGSDDAMSVYQLEQIVWLKLLAL
jgi:hypothetical protein